MFQAVLLVSSRFAKNNAPVGIIIGTRTSGGKELVGEKRERETHIELFKAKYYLKTKQEMSFA